MRRTAIRLSGVAAREVTRDLCESTRTSASPISNLRGGESGGDGEGGWNKVSC